MTLLRIAAAVIVTIVLAWLAAPTPAHALSCTASITDLVFDDVDTLAGTQSVGTATMNISCTAIGLTGVRVCPYLGDGSGGRDAGGRYLDGTSASLNYDLYTDGAHSMQWGNPSLGFGTFPTVDFAGNLAGTGTGSTMLTIYGLLPGGQGPVPADTYTSAFTAADVDIQWGINVLGLISCSGIQILTNHLHPTFNVSATVPKKCLVSTSDVAFGSHGVLSASVAATGGVTVQCTPQTDYAVTLDNGDTGTGPTARLMTKGSETVTYGLYKDSAHTEPWGLSGGDVVGGTGSGLEEPFDVFGLVPPQPTPSPGLYQDTVTATVMY